MRINARIPCSASQILILFVRYVDVCLCIPVLFSKTKVDEVNLVASLAQAHEEVIGFDIAVNKIFSMDVLDSGNLFANNSCK
jgi:hypothetical protein